MAHTVDNGTRCTATCWKGNPASSMAAKARCKKFGNHAGNHLDENGNNFTGTGADSQVIVIRKAANA